MSIRFKLLDSAYLPDSGIIVYDSVLPRVGETMTLARYKGDEEVPIVERVVVKVTRKVMLIGKVDGEESGSTKTPEVFLGPVPNP